MRKFRFTITIFHNAISCMIASCHHSILFLDGRHRQWDARTGMNTALGGCKAPFSAWHGRLQEISGKKTHELSEFIQYYHKSIGFIIDFVIIIYGYLLYLLILSYLVPKKFRLQLDRWLMRSHTLASSTPHDASLNQHFIIKKVRHAHSIHGTGLPTWIP